MARKVFVSYKYADDNVESLNSVGDTTCRDYVDKLESKIGKDHIYKGEEDGEDLSDLEDDTIKEKLKERLHDSTVTIVLISSGMKEDKQEKEQWIPWEVSYSLKEISRAEKNSRSNGIVAVIIPDHNGLENHYWTNTTCDGCRIPVVEHKEAPDVFNIISKNKFNHTEGKRCQSDKEGCYSGEHYIASVSWKKFFDDPDEYIEDAYRRAESKEEYEICKEI